jgi:Putative prokaryotic signal transducing protein
MEFVQLRSFDNYISAHISLGMLQDAGINCHLKDEYMVTIQPFLSPALGGMKLMVYPSQIERASRLLEETEQRGEGD